MFSSLKSAVRFFAFGFVAGILFAPREGRQTRQLLADKFSSLRKNAAELAVIAVLDGVDALSEADPMSSPGSQRASDKKAVASNEDTPTPKEPARKRTTRRSRAMGK